MDPLHTAQTYDDLDNNGKCKWTIRNTANEVITGYLATIDRDFANEFPNDIIKILMTYTNLNTLDNILVAANGEEFESNDFKIGDVMWKLQLKPNGFDEKQIGSCNIYLCLVWMPSLWSEITISQTIKSVQTYASHKHMQRYHTGKSYGWGTYTLSLEELKAGNYDHITFEAEIKLLCIKYDTDKDHIVEYIYSPKLMKHSEFIWKVEEQLLNILTQSRVDKVVFMMIYVMGYLVYSFIQMVMKDMKENVGLV